MDFDKLAKHPILKWVLYFTLWTVIGVFWATRMWLLYKDAGTDAVTWMEAMTLGLMEWYWWAILTIPIFKLSTHLRFDRTHWARSLSVHIGAAVAVSVLHVALYNLAFRPLDVYFMQTEYPLGMESWWDSYWLWLRSKFHVGMMAYAVIALISYAVTYYQRYKQEELRASELRAQLAGAQLEALKSQLHPHFLFNALHTVSSLMHDDIEAADRVVSRLGDLLRRSLQRVDRQTVPLKEEIDFAERYLEIERFRFSDRMTTDIRVQPAVRDASVPSLILQPLIENAVRHGIAGTREGGTVRVSAERDGETLRLEVANDLRGAQATASDQPGEGVGLRNTRERLQRLYGDRHQLAIENGAGTEFRVIIRIPYEPHTAGH
jgi:two-component system LytT family sensor kinase